MAQAETVAREQTMDEILASIRRIIQSHDEPEQAVAAPVAAKPEPVSEPQDLEAFRLALANEERAQPAAPAAAPAVQQAAPAVVDAPLVSDAQWRKVAAAFDELSAIMKRSNERQLADRAEDMLKPMLQEWLDENLPSIVERLVREEIERIARGGL